MTTTLANRLTRNHLLAHLRTETLVDLLPKFERVVLPLRASLSSPETPIDAVYFLESGLISMVASLEDGTQAEVGLIGWEGMAPLPSILGVDMPFVETYVQADGTALRMDIESFRAELETNVPFRVMLLRYSEAMHCQAMQTAACNGRHSLEQRLARWLLMAHDRTEGDHLAITQEFLALMLCVYRPSITVVAGVLQKAGLIRYTKGVVTIVHRCALEQVSCGCYTSIRERFLQVLGGTKS